MNYLKRRIKFKDGLDADLLQYVHPYLWAIVSDIALLAISCGEECITVTSLVRSFQDGISNSSTHQTGRAVDIRCNDLSEATIKEIMTHIPKKWEEVAAVNSSGHNRLIVRHGSGLNDHLHVQIHARYIGD